LIPFATPASSRAAKSPPRTPRMYSERKNDIFYLHDDLSLFSPFLSLRDRGAGKCLEVGFGVELEEFVRGGVGVGEKSILIGLINIFMD
jgi:hypothetical protein